MFEGGGSSHNSKEFVHPANKSLTVFPALPRKDTGLVGRRTSDNEEQRASGSRLLSNVSSFGKTQTQVNDSKSLSQSISRMYQNSDTRIMNAHAQPQHHQTSDKEQRSTIRQTRKRLDKVTKKMHSIKQQAAKANAAAVAAGAGREWQTMASRCLLPSISLPATKNLDQTQQNGERLRQKFLSLPCIEEHSKCTAAKCAKCGSRKKTNKEKLVDSKITSSTKEFRPDMMPLQRTIQVRWKHKRDGSQEHSRDSLYEIYGNFGEIERMQMKSEAVCMILYTTIDSACTATRVMQKVGKEMNLATRWMAEKTDQVHVHQKKDKTKPFSQL